VKRHILVILAVGAALACNKDAPTSTGAVVVSLTLNAPSNSIIVGATLQLTATLLDINGHEVSDGSITWQSSATTIATVAPNGVVTGRGVGTARIRATSGSARDSVEVTVTTNTFDVSTPGEVFSPAFLNVPVGATVRFLIYGSPHDVEFADVPGSPPDIPVVNNVTVARSFNVPGTFPYDCNVHPGMSGEIVVQ
jgi:plastocyanin